MFLGFHLKAPEYQMSATRLSSELHHMLLLVATQMITVNFEDYPEHRLKFFALLHAITNHCFKCLFAMSAPQVKLLIDSIIWAFRHTERNVAETGLLLLEVR